MGGMGAVGSVVVVEAWFGGIGKLGLLRMIAGVGERERTDGAGMRAVVIIVGSVNSDWGWFTVRLVDLLRLGAVDPVRDVLTRCGR